MYVRVSLCVIVLSMFTDFWKGLSDVKMDEQKDVSSCVSNALLKTVWMSGLMCLRFTGCAKTKSYHFASQLQLNDC